ncbi:unnamed protein product [Danaus chrysippus]|uniref:Fatty acyl-CoA reductase n=1 Tax=Danaus chrysippus TaxID=151541 RepID=A0A8J2RCV6_9NEOP|nr:unnamed protein product [Danaus chrysippus]
MEIVRKIEEKGFEKSLRVKQALESGNSDVVKVYDGAVLFITGGSGFVGKQLVEKILRTCNVKKIYLLLRPKKGNSAIQRLNQILEDPVYESLRSQQPDFASKLIPVEGNVIDLNLGIDEESRQKIIEEVNIIFHGAATINFEETIKVATLTNLRGTREILNLAKSCKQLKSLVHVSTAYVHATKSRIKTEVKEDFYKSPLPPDALIELAESLENEQLQKIVEPLKTDWPNSYTFTKAVTEELVKQKAADLPICIVRPAIVISAYNEPRPGWVDIKNAYGPSGMLLGLSLGVSHTVHADTNIMFDFVPVDIVNNALIVAAWKTHERYIAGERQLKIYVVTGSRNPIYYRDMINVLKDKGRSLVSPKAIWHSFSIITKYKLIYILLTWLLHYIPGYLVDGCCMLIGQKPRFIKIYKKVYSVSSVFVYFTNNDWIFRDDNALELYNQMNYTDKEIFTCDMKQINIASMLLTWFYGISKHNVRSPSTKNLENFSDHPWPKWNISDLYLTEKGALLEEYMGEYIYNWLVMEKLFVEGCPEENSVLIYANTKQRCRSSAKAFVRGAFDKCNISVVSMNSDEADPIFNPIIRNDSETVKEPILNEMEYKLRNLNLSESYLALEGILDLENSIMCRNENQCRFCDEDKRISYNVGDIPRIIDDFSWAFVIVDSFLMSYYDGLAMENVAWGKIKDSEQWKTLTRITNENLNICFNSKLLGRQVAKPLLEYILSVVTRDIPKKFTLLHGHDANLLSVLASLDVKEFLLPDQYEIIPIGGKLVFQRWYDATQDRDLFKLDYVYLTAGQIREGSKLSTNNPPRQVQLFIKDCPVDSDGFCSWEDFVKVLNDAASFY